MLNFIKTFLLCLHLIDARIIYNHIFLLVKSQFGALFFYLICPSHRLYAFLYYCRLFYTSNLFNTLYALSCHFNNKKIGRKYILYSYLFILINHSFIKLLLLSLSWNASNIVFHNEVNKTLSFYPLYLRLLLTSGTFYI